MNAPSATAEVATATEVSSTESATAAAMEDSQVLHHGF